MPLIGIIGETGVICNGDIFGEITFLAQEAGDFILQESGDKIIT